MTVQQPSQTLMFAYDYSPGQTLQMVARLQQAVTRSILGQQIDDGGTIVSDTSEWDTHLANYQLQGDPPVPGEYVLVFTRNGQIGDQLQLDPSATFFNGQFNLLEVTVSTGGGTPTPQDGTPTPEGGTPTPEGGTPTPQETPTPTPGDGGGNGGGNGGDGGGGGDGG